LVNATPASKKERPMHGTNRMLANVDCGCPRISLGWLRHRNKHELTRGSRSPLANAATRMTVIAGMFMAAGSTPTPMTKLMKICRPYLRHGLFVCCSIDLSWLLSSDTQELHPRRSCKAIAVASGVAKALESPAPASPRANPIRPPSPITSVSGAMICWILNVAPVGLLVGALEATSISSNEMIAVRADDRAIPSCALLRLEPLAIEDPSSRLSGTHVVPTRESARGAAPAGMWGSNPAIKSSMEVAGRCAIVAEKQRIIRKTKKLSTMPMLCIDLPLARRSATLNGTRRTLSVVDRVVELDTSKRSMTLTTPIILLHSDAKDTTSVQPTRRRRSAAGMPRGANLKIHSDSVKPEAKVKRAAPSCIIHATAAAITTHQSSSDSNSFPAFEHSTTVPGPIVAAVRVVHTRSRLIASMQSTRLRFISRPKPDERYRIGFPF